MKVQRAEKCNSPCWQHNLFIAVLGLGKNLKFYDNFLLPCLNQSLKFIVLMDLMIGIFNFGSDLSVCTWPSKEICSLKR